MIHDFCGGLEEDLLRTNFILVYELIDEILVSGSLIIDDDMITKFCIYRTMASHR